MRNSRVAAIVCIFTLILGSSVAARAFRLPDTGQTRCYSQLGAIITCPSPEDPLAQDGSYTINPMSFTDNGNNTVTDNNTGLIWQKNENSSTYNWHQASGTYDATYNPSSTDVCGSLNLGGRSDWRLPSKKELTTIVNYGIPSPGPVIDTTYFPSAVADGYWSFTTHAGNASEAWVVLFSSGPVGVIDKGAYYGYVRCVRTGPLAFGSFLDNGNGTATDRTTGLMWQQGEGGSLSPWSSALDYCEGLDLGGHADWRLPNIREIESLTDVTRYSPAIDTIFFPGAHSDNDYWSSTSVEDTAVLPWCLDFGPGSVTGDFDKNASRYVRCVRAGESGGSLDTVSVSKTGTGSGTVVSWPTGINCGSACLAPFPTNSAVVLSATPVVGGSIFAGWSESADCADGVVTVAAGVSCTATFDFCPAKPARIGTTEYDSIYHAYMGAATNGDTIKIIASNEQEALIFDRPVTVTIEGGYDCSYASRIGMTTLTGALIVEAGQAIVDGVAIGGLGGYIPPSGITVEPSVLPSGTVGAAYDQTVAMSATGGTGPYAYRCHGSGTATGLGTGLDSVDPTKCRITGTPATVGTYTVTFTSTDGTTSLQRTISFDVTAGTPPPSFMGLQPDLTYEMQIQPLGQQNFYMLFDKDILSQVSVAIFTNDWATNQDLYVSTASSIACVPVKTGTNRPPNPPPWYKTMPGNSESINIYLTDIGPVPAGTIWYATVCNRTNSIGKYKIGYTAY